MFEADRHNFNQCVERISRASGFWYRKPRSTFWEHLFFGKNSPLLPLFNSIGSNGTRPLSDYLFHLNVEIDHPWLGYSQEIRSDSNNINLEHFYSFGVLLGYCYLFGIRDLHKYNLVVKENHLQVIDAEVVLTNLILPNETLLFPFKEIPFTSSAASLIMSALNSCTQVQYQKILCGYFDIATVIIDKLDPICSIFEDKSISSHPIRVILKNTQHYRDFLNGLKKDDGFFNEEIIQMKRGDIPYFFKYVGQKNLYYCSTKSSIQSVKTVPSSLLKDINRHSSTLPVLLPSTTEAIKKVATGALWLLKSSKQTNKFYLHEGIELAEQTLSLKQFSFTTKN